MKSVATVTDTRFFAKKTNKFFPDRRLRECLNIYAAAKVQIFRQAKNVICPETMQLSLHEIISLTLHSNQNRLKQIISETKHSLFRSLMHACGKICSF